MDEEETEKQLEETEKRLETLSAKVDELTKLMKEKKVLAEEKIKENPLAYVIGAFSGGLLVGFLLGKIKEGKE